MGPLSTACRGSTSWSTMSPLSGGGVCRAMCTTSSRCAAAAGVRHRRRMLAPSTRRRDDHERRLGRALITAVSLRRRSVTPAREADGDRARELDPHGFIVGLLKSVGSTCRRPPACARRHSGTTTTICAACSARRPGRPRPRGPTCRHRRAGAALRPARRRHGGGHHGRVAGGCGHARALSVRSSPSARTLAWGNPQCEPALPHRSNPAGSTLHRQPKIWRRSRSLGSCLEISCARFAALPVQNST
jgi:hypothetical protein